VSGLVKSGTFNTLTGKAASSGSTTTDITLSTGTSLTASTSAIPQVATITLKLSYSGSTYSVSLGSVTLTGGNEYCYNITVKKYEVLACSSSITSWSNGASSTIASSKTYGALRYPQNAGDYMYSDGSYDLYTTTLTSEKKSACTGVYIGEVNGVGRVITYVGGYVYYYEIYEDYYKLGTVADCYFIYENITQINSSLENCGMNSVYNKNYNNYFWIYNKEICDSLDYDIDAIPYCMFNSARIEFGTIYESYYDAYDEEMYVNHRYFYVSNCYKLN
jgi:hypothetical protein